jgi:hypothetical protein
MVEQHQLQTLLQLWVVQVAVEMLMALRHEMVQQVELVTQAHLRLRLEQTLVTVAVAVLVLTVQRLHKLLLALVVQEFLVVVVLVQLRVALLQTQQVVRVAMV